jgi:hypothetical protein
MLDKIKDSERWIVNAAQASEYYYYEGTLAENQSFQSPVINAQGKARLAYLFAVVGTPPAAIAFYIDVSAEQSFARYWERVSVSTTGSSGGDIVLPAQFFRIRVKSGSTAGSYNYRVFAALHPVS